MIRFLKHCVPAAAFLLSGVASLNAQEISSHVDLLGQLDSHSNYGDIWGYVAPDGKEYALLNVRGKGVAIIDINGIDPVEVGFAAATGASTSFPDAKDVKVYGHYIILVNEYQPVQIFDIDSVDNPIEISTIHIGDLTTNGGAHNALVEGNYLYVTGGHGALGQGVSIFDITEPATPVAVGGRHFYYYHDLEVKNGIGYGAAAGNGIDILNLSDKANPILINNFGYTGQWVHNISLSSDNNYIYVGDENGSAGRWTRIFNISDAMNPFLVSEIIVDSATITHNSYEKDNYLFIAHYVDGLQVFDVSDKSAPHRVAFYDTHTDPSAGFGGAWSVYPFFPSGKIILSDLQEGLFVFRLDGTLETVAGASTLPDHYALEQNFPNPFNASTVVRYSLPNDGTISLTIHDLLGHRVATLADGWQQAGRHRAQWHSGSHPSGVYFALLTTPGGFRQTIKLTLLK